MESFRIWLLLVFALVSGCASIDPLERYQDTGAATVLPQTSYHTDVVAHDGTVLRATVFQPALEPGAKAPIATWYNLQEALAPNEVVQSFWPFALDWLGTLGSGFDFDLINETSYQAALSGKTGVQRQP